MVGCIVLENHLSIHKDSAMGKRKGTTQRIHTEKEKAPPGDHNLGLYYLLYNRSLYSTRLHLWYNLLL